MKLDLNLLTDEIYNQVIQYLDTESLAHHPEEDFLKELNQFIKQFCREKKVSLEEGDIQKISTDIFHDFMGFGPLEYVLGDKDITEIMVNNYHSVYIERKGRITKSDITFRNPQHVFNVAHRIATRIHRRIDSSSPLLNSRLPDGSRVNAVLNPISLDGTCITIRKFSKDPLTIDKLLEYETLTPKMAEFLRICTLCRANILVSGGTGSGKTTFLNVLSHMIPHDERVITIEDSAELQLNVDNLIRLESREPNAEGKGEITIYDLVRNCLRMRPDRVIVGEVRGAEAFEMLKVLNTGHDGSMSTIHSNDALSSLLRLENMIATHHPSVPPATILAQIASAVDLILHVKRYRDGSRRVSEIVNIGNYQNGQVETRHIFKFVVTGETPEGQIIGHYQPSNEEVSFISKITAYNLHNQLQKCLESD